jgi:hypothetical protein
MRGAVPALALHELDSIRPPEGGLVTNYFSVSK